MARDGKSGNGKVWGYVEGYYGRLLRWEERDSLIGRLASLGGNAYLYAPKEDSLHRRDWRLPYPAPWRRRFRASAIRARRLGVDLVPGMAPGLSFDYRSEADYRRLLRKLEAFRALGCRTLALLMDDIPAVLPASCRGAFRSLGEAHGRLLARLLRDLGGGPAAGGGSGIRGEPKVRGESGIRLWFCPTVYTDQFASGPVERDPYLTDLAATMPPGVTVMWTGPRIISAAMGAREIGPLCRMFGGRVLLWDNLYANDYCPNKIFLGPYRGRARETWSLTEGVLLNPTGLPATDDFLLGLLADSRRGRPAVASWSSALRESGVPEEFRAVARFLDSPFFVPGASDLSPRRAAACRKALKRLIWDWKGALHQEWYPYLFMLDADLKASGRGADAPDAEWVRKRYSPLVARLLLK